MRIFWALSLSTCLITANPAAAEEPAPRWFSVSSFAGATYFDTALDNFRWDVTGSPSYGLQTQMGFDRWSGGLRATSATTHQATGIPGEDREPTVRLTTLEAMGQTRLVSAWGFTTTALAHAGWMHLGYSPDRLTVDPLGNGATVDVAFSPIDDWIVGAELALRHALVGGLALGLHIDRSYFWLDTSHRNGADIEERRERFGNWTVRAQLSWTLARP